MTVHPDSKGATATIGGGILNGQYAATGVRFHWGNSSAKGSEHVIDNHRFDAEMQIVHRNVLYSTDEEAFQNANGFAILSIMMDIVDVSFHQLII